MTRKSKAISDVLYEQAKASLKELGASGESGQRLQALISAKTKGIILVAEVFGITRMTLMTWIQHFEGLVRPKIALQPDQRVNEKKELNLFINF